RLRPILMTTTAMIFGMLPVALGTGSGSESRSPMAIAVIGGLVASTLLTLVVVPVVYTLLDDLSHPSRWRLAPWLRATTGPARPTVSGHGARPVRAAPPAPPPPLPGSGPGAPPAGPAPPEPQRPAPKKVLSAAAATAPLAATRPPAPALRAQYLGEIVPAATLDLMSTVGGRLLQVRKRLGDPVAKGEVVAVMDDEEKGKEVNE